ncbi:MAG: hypothetical protein DRO36_00245 [Candidatus Hecatellales archaeon]|nr:MAG: hypothetical protein DRO36_00245 [Candidatus Hecatellales archaeon]
MKSYDVVVVGAGPIGSRVAYLTAKKGWKTLLVEEHKVPGKPSHCAGKIYVEAFKEFNLPREAIVGRVRGAYFYSPKGYMFKVLRRSIDSYIVDREILDFRMAEEASNVGAVLSLKTKCYGFEGENRLWYTVKLKRGDEKFEVKTRVLVDAEGWNPIIAKKAGLWRNIKYLKGLQYEMDNVNFNHEEFVELYFGEKFFPGFFGWIIPLGDGKARVGLCVNKDLTLRSPAYHLKKALKLNKEIFRKTREGKVLKVFGGFIPIHGPLKRLVFGRIVLVGDSAGQVKSTTGGGIYFGLKASDLAGEAISNFLESGKYGALRFYEKAFWRSYGWRLKFTSFIRRLLDRFSDDELDGLFRLVGENKKFLAKVEKECSSQSQVKVFGLMVKEPKLLLGLSKFALKSFLW